MKGYSLKCYNLEYYSLEYYSLAAEKSKVYGIYENLWNVSNHKGKSGAEDHYMEWL